MVPLPEVADPPAAPTNFVILALRLLTALVKLTMQISTLSWAHCWVVGHICVGDSKPIGDIKILEGSIKTDGMETNVDDGMLCCA